MLTVRPKVAEMVFQLYGRPLHPELFEAHGTQIIERGGYRAHIAITSAGHVVTWRYDGITLTEVCTGAHHPLPERRRLLSYRLQGERNDHVECRGGIKYTMSFQLEHCDPEVFWTLQQEYALDGEREGILHRFDSNGRMALGAMSFIKTDSRNKSLCIHAFHTYPDDYAIVKSQSYFQLPEQAPSSK